MNLELATAPPRRPVPPTALVFAAFLALGSGCLHVPPETTTNVAEARDEIELEPSGDVDLDVLRALGARAPLDDLFAKAPAFLAAQVIDYRTDPILWHGVDRLSAEIIENPERRVNYTTIGVLCQNIRTLAPPAEFGLEARLPALEARLAEERKRR